MGRILGTSGRRTVTDIYPCRLAKEVKWERITKYKYRDGGKSRTFM